MVTVALIQVYVETEATLPIIDLVSPNANILWLCSAISQPKSSYVVQINIRFTV